jgi:hypothetical protein
MFVVVVAWGILYKVYSALQQFYHGMIPFVIMLCTYMLFLIILLIEQVKLKQSERHRRYHLLAFPTLKVTVPTFRGVPCILLSYALMSLVFPEIFYH